MFREQTWERLSSAFVVAVRAAVMSAIGTTWPAGQSQVRWCRHRRQWPASAVHVSDSVDVHDSCRPASLQALCLSVLDTCCVESWAENISDLLSPKTTYLCRHAQSAGHHVLGLRGRRWEWEDNNTHFCLNRYFVLDSKCCCYCCLFSCTSHMSLFMPFYERWLQMLMLTGGAVTAFTINQVFV